ncbi:glutathione S-transferase N-terminal domain-containing protein [Staphylococcus epidermidis]|nr:glutathione S-transferase N-terminal domain-containing protein [Staphylococcus epidermidis]
MTWRLFLNATSPFARVARVIALEKGLNPELVRCDPWANDPALPAVHPQARIPVLLTEDGHAIAESLLIAQYLDTLGHGASLLPAQERWPPPWRVPCGLWLDGSGLQHRDCTQA